MSDCATRYPRRYASDRFRHFPPSTDKGSFGDDYVAILARSGRWISTAYENRT